MNLFDNYFLNDKINLDIIYYNYRNHGEYGEIKNKKKNRCFTATPIDWHRHRRKKIHGQTKNRKRIPTRH